LMDLVDSDARARTLPQKITSVDELPEWNFDTTRPACTPESRSQEPMLKSCPPNGNTKAMREEGGLKVIKAAMEKLALRQNEHVEVYGEDNDKRMTGRHEDCFV
jgi:hypothetical protein